MSDFQRRHYVILAKLIGESQSLVDLEYKLIAIFKADNANFNELRFKAAVVKADCEQFNDALNGNEQQ